MTAEKPETAAPERIGLISDGMGRWALAHRDEADFAVHYIRADLAATPTPVVASEPAPGCQQPGLTTEDGDEMRRAPASPRHDWAPLGELVPHIEGSLRNALSCRACGMLQNEGNIEMTCMGKVEVVPRDAPASPRPEREALALIIEGWVGSGWDAALSVADATLAAGYLSPTDARAAERRAWEAGRDAVVQIAVAAGSANRKAAMTAWSDNAAEIRAHRANEAEWIAAQGRALTPEDRP